MRKPLLFTALLLVLNYSFCLGLSVELDVLQEQVRADDNITLKYNISLPSEQLINYSIVLVSNSLEVVIVEESKTSQALGGVINYNISNIITNNYTVELRTNVLSIPITDDLEILPELQFSVLPESYELVAWHDSSVFDIMVTNTGNTPLYFSISPGNFIPASAEPVIGLSKNTFPLSIGETQVLSVNVSKIDFSYNFSLVMRTQGGEFDFPVKVINPSGNVTLAELDVAESEISGLILSTCNVPQNVTVMLESSKDGEFSTQEYKYDLNPYESVNLSIGLEEGRIPSRLTVSSQNSNQVIELGGSSLISRINDFISDNFLAVSLAVIILIIIILIPRKIKGKNKKRLIYERVDK